MLETFRLLSSEPADIERAAELLRAGRLVAFATETVYGLGASALSAEAVAGIFTAKQRPGWDPLIVHIASVDDIDRIAMISGELRKRVEALAAAFWPGPLTMLLPKSAAVPDMVTAGRPLVGVRVPAHPAAQALLHATGLPIAAPSANRFGHTSPTTADHVLADLGGRIDAVLDAGPTQVGIESTVVDVTRTPIVQYRPGAVTAQQIEAVCGVAVEVYVPGPEERRPESTAVAGRGYPPLCAARAGGAGGRYGRGCAAQGELSSRGSAAVQRRSASSFPSAGERRRRQSFNPGRRGTSPDRLAATLFAGLRALDGRGVNHIVCPLPAPGGVYDAIRDRLMKAAREK